MNEPTWWVRKGQSGDWWAFPFDPSDANPPMMFPVWAEAQRWADHHARTPA